MDFACGMESCTWGIASPLGLEHRTHWPHLVLNHIIHLEARENQLASDTSCPHTFSFLGQTWYLAFLFYLKFCSCSFNNFPRWF